MAMAFNNNGVLSDVIKSLAKDALQDVRGVSLISEKRNSNAISVDILPNEKVKVVVRINIEYGYSVPTTVATLQEAIKKQIEGATRFVVNSVNVEVVGVLDAQ